MTKNNLSIYIFLGIAALALAALACGSVQIGVATPTGEVPVDPLHEAIDYEAEAEPLDSTPAEPSVEPTAEPPVEAAADDSTEIAVTAWLGHIASLPDGSQYDDFVLLSPEGTGEFGLKGATPEVEAEIRDLRDADGPREFVHLWGTLSCGVADYNDCQLVVDKAQYGANFSEEEISGWEGTIKSSTFNSATSYVFELQNPFPMWFSIYASQDETLKAEIERLRDTGAVVRVSGKLMVGIPDVNGTRIEISSLKVLEAGSAVQLELDDSIDPTADWPVFVNDRYGYQIRYPKDATINLFGPMRFPTEDLPAGMDTDQYMDELTKTYTDRLCVEIKYGLGVIYISAPPNQEKAYTPCGPTGLGSGEVINKTEYVYVGEALYQVNIMEHLLELSDGAGGVLRGETLDFHSELAFTRLDDHTRIFFGSVPNHEANYQDYLMKTREVLLQVLTTYEKTP